LITTGELYFFGIFKLMIVQKIFIMYYILVRVFIVDAIGAAKEWTSAAKHPTSFIELIRKCKNRPKPF